jgi:hypothetical protein
MEYFQNIIYRIYLELGTAGMITVGGLAFVGVASSRITTGEDMERPHRVGQLYGYTVCLVAVITFLTSVSGVIRSVASLANPISYTESPFRMGFEPSLSSFEAFRATYMFGGSGVVFASASVRGEEPTPRRDTLSTVDLRARFEALRAERIGVVSQAATTQLVTSALLMLITVILFVTHWRWVRVRERRFESATSAA